MFHTFVLGVPVELWWLAFGAIAGFMAGLIGIGGACILVPLMYLVFNELPEFADTALVMSLGTAMAAVPFNALASALGHNKRDAVDMRLVKLMAPYALPAAVFGAFLSTHLPSASVKLAFALYCLYVGFRLLFISRLHPVLGAKISPNPTRLASGAFGTVCGMIGGGGGSLFVPYLVKRNIDVRRAIGTASALNVPITIIGTGAYIGIGLFDTGLPKGSLGYVYMPALVMVVLGGILFTIIGVRAAHALPISAVKRIFAVSVAAIGLQMVGMWPLVTLACVAALLGYAMWEHKRVQKLAARPGTMVATD